MALVGKVYNCDLCRDVKKMDGHDKSLPRLINLDKETDDM